MCPEEAQALAPGIEATREFSVEGELVTDVGGTIGVGIHELRVIDAGRG